MKKAVVVAAVALFGASVFAAGFSVSGNVYAGISTTLNSKNDDGDKDEKIVSTDTAVAGDYFGQSSDVTLTASYESKGGVCGAAGEIEFTDEFENLLFDNFAFNNIYGWGKFLDKKITVEAGMLADNYMSTWGYEDFSLADGTVGVLATIAPSKSLNLTAAIVKDYLSDDKDTTEVDSKFSGDAFIIGARYSLEKFTFTTSFSPKGMFIAGLTATPKEPLFLAFEYAYESDDSIEEMTNDSEGYFGPLYGCTHTFVENIEYTGVKNLTLSLASYQYITCDDSDLIVSITPAAKYVFNKIVSVSLESTIYAVDDTVDDFDSWATFVPCVSFSASDSCSVNIWASLCTDDDQDTNKIGIGILKDF